MTELVYLVNFQSGNNLGKAPCRRQAVITPVFFQMTDLVLRNAEKRNGMKGSLCTAYISNSNNDIRSGK